MAQMAHEVKSSLEELEQHVSLPRCVQLQHGTRNLPIE
jgi:hypothetical protein